MPLQNPVIVLPGITATTLVDQYPLNADEIWSLVFNREYERAALHPDDLRFDAIEPAQVVAGRIFPVYDDLIKSLRHELSPQADQPTPVFAFPYDWRMDVRLTAARLRPFVEEVIARTRLLKHYANAGDLKVDLVGHSMGGLVICEYLSQFGRGAHVGKVVTIGTPFLGSVEAVVKIATGMSLLTGSEPRERERETARVTPSLYQLFPSYAGAVVDRAGRDVDMFDPANIQSSVVESLAAFVRLYAVGTRARDRRARAERLLSDLLEWGRKHRQTVAGFRTSEAGVAQGDWLVIAGAGQRTRLQLGIDGSRRAPRYIINDQQFVNELGALEPNSLRTGDGTVPLPGAIPPFLPASRLVCVTEDDLNFFELRDRLLVEVGGMHGLLPRINLVQRLIVRHLLPRYRGDVWGRRVPGSDSWNPPIENLPEKSYL
ncbi:MAG TPA: alpha/beta fold hydrolase [Woeseiaceae bacterium]|nr:alpha/beta fold hydrolase [Woeseiaceae bacterium]